MPFQMNGFYNRKTPEKASSTVVIPFQMNGFYNKLSKRP